MGSYPLMQRFRRRSGSGGGRTVGVAGAAVRLHGQTFHMLDKCGISSVDQRAYRGLIGGSRPGVPPTERGVRSRLNIKGISNAALRTRYI